MPMNICLYMSTLCIQQYHIVLLSIVSSILEYDADQLLILKSHITCVISWVAGLCILFLYGKEVT